MAFYDVVLLYEDAFEESKGGKDRGTFTINRTLLAKSDTKNPSFVTIGNSTAGWPGLNGEAIDQLNGLRNFDGIVARCASRKFSWYSGTESGVQIDLTYEGLSPYVNTESGGSEQPRTLETVTWRRIGISTSQITVPATNGLDDPEYNGKTFTNSAGDPVDGLEEEASLAVLKYTNEYNPNPALYRIWHWLNSCNDTEFLGAPPYTLKVTGFSAEFDDKTMLWKTALEITFNPKGWEIPFYDAGFNEIVADGPSLVRKAIKDINGNPVSQPVPLNGLGGQAVIEYPISQIAEKGVAKVMGNAATLYGAPYPRYDFNLMLQDLRMY